MMNDNKHIDREAEAEDRLMRLISQEQGVKRHGIITRNHRQALS